MTIYKLNLNDNGYSVQELETIGEDTSAYEYLNQGERLSVSKRICYSKMDYNSDNPIYIEPPRRVKDSWFQPKSNSSTGYIAFSFIKPDEKIKNIFFKEIERYLNYEISREKNELNKVTIKYDEIYKQKEQFLSLIFKKKENCSKEEIISPSAEPVTIQEANKLLYQEWKKLVNTDCPNPRLLVAYQMACKALETIDKEENKETDDLER